MAEEVTENAHDDPDRRRYGHLYVTADFMERDLYSVAAGFEGCVVIHCDYLHHMRRYDYVIWHHDLDPVPLGEVPQFIQRFCIKMETAPFAVCGLSAHDLSPRTHHQ